MSAFSLAASISAIGAAAPPPPPTPPPPSLQQSRRDLIFLSILIRTPKIPPRTGVGGSGLGVGFCSVGFSSVPASGFSVSEPLDLTHHSPCPSGVGIPVGRSPVCCPFALSRRLTSSVGGIKRFSSALSVFVLLV